MPGLANPWTAVRVSLRLREGSAAIRHEERLCQAARQIAETYLDAKQILGRVLECVLT